MRQTLFFPVLLAFFAALFSYVSESTGVAVRSESAFGVRSESEESRPWHGMAGISGNVQSDYPCTSEIPFRQVVEQVCQTNRNTPNTTVRVTNPSLSLSIKGFHVHGVSLLGVKKLPVSYCTEVPLFLFLLNLLN